MDDLNWVKESINRINSAAKHVLHLSVLYLKKRATIDTKIYFILSRKLHAEMVKFKCRPIVLAIVFGAAFQENLLHGSTIKTKLS